jgi:hypothetical protein
LDETTPGALVREKTMAGGTLARVPLPAAPFAARPEPRLLSAYDTAKNRAARPGADESELSGKAVAIIDGVSRARTATPLPIPQ